MGREGTQGWGKRGGGGGCVQQQHRGCGRSGEKENKCGWKFSRRHQEPFEALEYIFFLIRAGLRQILPGRSSRMGAGISLCLRSRSCFAALSRFGGPGEAGAGEV